MRRRFAHRVAPSHLATLVALLAATGCERPPARTPSPETVARAHFAPGLSGDEQIVHADVANVGRINFAVVVSPSAIRVLAPPMVWSGDAAVAGAELRDVDGNVLPGGFLSWGTTDTTVLHPT